jgi:hypothetical protein
LGDERNGLFFILSYFISYSYFYFLSLFAPASLDTMLLLLLLVVVVVVVFGLPFRDGEGWKEREGRLRQTDRKTGREGRRESEDGMR